VSRRSVAENRAKMPDRGLRHVLLQKQRETDDLYRVGGTPSAVLVAVDGRVASPLATGADAIRALVLRSLAAPLPAPSYAGNGDHALPPPLAVGEPAPAIALPDLDGDVVRLEDFRGRSTLVLFWNPGCGFCQQMLPDVKAWEAAPPRGSPALLVVSTGTAEANRMMKLRSAVVLDQRFEAGRALGAAGTPSAVLVNADGRVASDIAVGAERVLSLARGEEMVGLRGRT
jgi:peroxiredoxin